jgi:hypothetical protein
MPGCCSADEPYKRPMAMVLSAVVTATYLTRLPDRLYWRQLRKCRTMQATSRIPRRMPLPDSPLTEAVSDSQPIFDAPRTFPESNASHAIIRLICCRKSGIFCEVP